MKIKLIYCVCALAVPFFLPLWAAVFLIAGLMVFAFGFWLPVAVLSGVFLDFFHPSPLFFSKINFGIFTLSFMVAAFFIMIVRKNIKEKNIFFKLVFSPFVFSYFYLILLLFFTK